MITDTGEVRLKKLAQQAELKNQELGITEDDLFKACLESISRIPTLLQDMIDQIILIQEDWPMPPEGWEAFKQDIEYTNQKHEFELTIERRAGSCS